MVPTETDNLTAAAAGGFSPVPFTYRSKLSLFWPSKRASYFPRVEGQLYLDNITDKRRTDYMFLNTLPRSTVDLITNLVEGKLSEDSYAQLKTQLPLDTLIDQLPEGQKTEPNSSLRSRRSCWKLCLKVQ